MVLEDQFAVTPAGSPVADPIPVAPVVVCVILVKTVLRHKEGAADATPTVFSGITVILPVALASALQFPVRGII